MSKGRARRACRLRSRRRASRPPARRARPANGTARVLAGLPADHRPGRRSAAKRAPFMAADLGRGFLATYHRPRRPRPRRLSPTDIALEAWRVRAGGARRPGFPAERGAVLPNFRGKPGMLICCKRDSMETSAHWFVLEAGGLGHDRRGAALVGPPRRASGAGESSVERVDGGGSAARVPGDLLLSSWNERNERRPPRRRDRPRPPPLAHFAREVVGVALRVPRSQGRAATDSPTG